MANIILPWSELPFWRRKRLIAAYNICRERGHIPPDSHYDFEKRDGKWGIVIWRGLRERAAGMVWVDAKELMQAAGPLPVIMGVTEG